MKLRTKSGKVLVYENARACLSEDEREQTLCEHYTAVHDPARHLIVVNILQWEGAGYILIDDRTGDETVFDGEPTISPTGEHVVEITAGVDGYDATGPAVQVWRRRGGRFIVEWQGAPFAGDETFYRVISWEVPGQVELAVAARYWGRPGETSQATDRFFSLRRGGKGWQVVAD